MTTIGKEGGVDVAAAVVGDWSDVNFLATTGETYNIGNVTEGVLELTREDYVHFGTALPRVADFVVPIRAGMRFTGQASEHHRALYHALIGDTLTAASQYIYPGIQGCNVFFTLQIMRQRSCDGFVIEARIFKVHPGGLISMGSSDEAVTTPMELEGLDDALDDMGQGGSAAAPLGYLYVPVEGASVKVGGP